MALDSKNLSVMAYANGFTLWTYTTADALETVTTGGYFNNTSPFVKAGDMILANASVEGVLEPAVLSISSNTDGVVSVSKIS